ncbi:NAD(P)/FAD-dependent oxidoreductase [Haloimpatiens lingqiaonensis]|uniref:NAD(P)/FAD-dependent oxidoreductase n=1 Tax=Haloimpatiens lingqiaonensis TaxID=1380675 RepID=UPI0010FE89F1|nr:FAD-dependent oxidoreductase [Haloimpatiens lingqiaonensis]
MKYVIIGASAAALSAAKTLRELDKYSQIVMLSKDQNIYSRCLLHHYIGGERSLEELSFVEEDFMERYNIRWIKGINVRNIDIKNKCVELQGWYKEFYDKLLIASGSYAAIPPIKNLKEGNEVYTLRDIEDAKVIKEQSKDVKKALVIGAGLVGIDATMGLIENGVKVELVEMGERILPLQLDKRAAKTYEDLLRSHNVRISTGIGVAEAILNRAGNVKGAKLTNGEEIECDIIVVAAGVRPNVSFINDEEIKIDRGIVVNNRCETTVKDIYAAGDVTFTAPIWPIAVKQGKVAACNMAGREENLEDKFGLKNSMNFFNVPTVSLGMVEPEDSSYTVEIVDKNNLYKKIIHKDGIIYGAIFQGDISYCGVFTELIKNKINISSLKKDLFEISFSDFFHIKENGEFSYN